MNTEKNELKIVYAARYRGLSTASVHTHSIFQLYILNTPRLAVFDGKDSYVPDHSKEIVLIKPGEDHCLRLVYDAEDKNWFDKDINCTFDCKFSVNDKHLRDRLMELPRIIDVGDTAFHKSLSHFILTALSSGDEVFANYAFKTLVYSLISPGREDSSEPIFYTNNDDWRENTMGLNEIKNYIDCNYHEKIELEDLVRMSRMNRCSLCREFRRTYSTSPIHYILQKRIEESKVYLSESTVKISELSERLGFSSPSYFNRVFKQFVGESPGEYRSKNQSQSVKL